MNIRILRLPEVLELLGGISRSTIYRWVSAGTFPQPLDLGPRCMGWSSNDIDDWIRSRKRRGAPDGGGTGNQLSA